MLTEKNLFYKEVMLYLCNLLQWLIGCDSYTAVCSYVHFYSCGGVFHFHLEK